MIPLSYPLFHRYRVLHLYKWVFGERHHYFITGDSYVPTPWNPLGYLLYKDFGNIRTFISHPFYEFMIELLKYNLQSRCQTPRPHLNFIEWNDCQWILLGEQNLSLFLWHCGFRGTFFRSFSNILSVTVSPRNCV